MQQADEFASFSAARWTTLVRVALMLGAPEPVATEVVTDALSRLRPRWRRVRANGDPELEALALVLAAWDDVRTRGWWSQHPGADPPPATMVLDTLSPAERAALVVRHVGEVDPDVVDDTWGRSVHATPVDEQVWAAARSLPVGAPPPTRAALGVAGRRRGRRRRRTWTVRLLPAAMVVALVAVVLTVVSDGGSGDVPRRVTAQSLAAVEVQPGPDAWVTWYADGALHLGPVALQVPGVVKLVGVAGGAVYVDTAGRVVRIDPTGDRLLLGRADRTTSLVTSFDGGLVAWVNMRAPTDVSDAAEAALQSPIGAARAITVVDAVDGTGRRTLPLDSGDDAQPVGLRADRVYVANGTRSFAWLFRRVGPQGNPVTSGIGQPGLRSVVGELAVFGPDPADRDTAPSTVRVAFLDPADRYLDPALWIVRPGVEAALPPDGGQVLTRGAGGRVTLNDLATGTDLPTGVADDEVVLSTAVGPDDQLAYVVARSADRPGNDEVHSMSTGLLTVRTCTLSRSLAAVDCTDVASVSGNAATPLISG